MQSWIAITVYVLVAIVKKSLNSGAITLHNFTDFKPYHFREITNQLLQNIDTEINAGQIDNQLYLFEQIVGHYRSNSVILSTFRIEWFSHA